MQCCTRAFVGTFSRFLFYLPGDAETLFWSVCAIIGNMTGGQRSLDFTLSIGGKQIIRAYRDKTKIEDVFKNVKSYLKVRPIFVNTEKHVKAVYTICVLAYFRNRFLANQRKTGGEKDYLNSKSLYALFSNLLLILSFQFSVRNLGYSFAMFRLLDLPMRKNPGVSFYKLEGNIGF